MNLDFLGIFLGLLIGVSCPGLRWPWGLDSPLLLPGGPSCMPWAVGDPRGGLDRWFPSWSYLAGWPGGLGGGASLALGGPSPTRQWWWPPSSCCWLRLAKTCRRASWCPGRCYSSPVFGLFSISSFDSSELTFSVFVPGIYNYECVVAVSHKMV